MRWQQNLVLLLTFGLTSLLASSMAQAEHVLNRCDLTYLNKSTQQLDLKKLKGKVVYLDFWASWCPPCAKSFPFLNELQHQYYEDGLEIVGVNLDEVPEDAQQFLRKFPADFTIVGDLSKQCAKELGVAAMPSSYLIDRNGVIRHVHLGFRDGQVAELREKVEQLITETAL